VPSVLFLAPPLIHESDLVRAEAREVRDADLCGDLRSDSSAPSFSSASYPCTLTLAFEVLTANGIAFFSMLMESISFFPSFLSFKEEAHLHTFRYFYVAHLLLNTTPVKGLGTNLVYFPWLSLSCTHSSCTTS
jgi:hypothetical protein